MRARGVSGFSIVEVLVAILLLALGLLGGTAMQLSALRTRHQSALLSEAVHLASGMADRMRANVAQMRLGDAANPYLNLRYDAATDAAPSVPAHLCFGASPCSGAELASFDIYELEQQVRAALPGGRLVICRDAGLWDSGRRNATWDCGGGGAAPIVIKLGWRGKNPDGSPQRDDQRRYAPSVELPLTGAPE
ncbi:MAG TPA: type IV pilus modification protein PilV [Janthinobacterium sp.]|nr:type IV pilus modification protein PilV [Janthinobacterium sp.]